MQKQKRVSLFTAIPEIPAQKKTTAQMDDPMKTDDDIPDEKPLHFYIACNS